MDAIEFIKERQRMCKSFGTGCTGCPAFNVYGDGICCTVGQKSTIDAAAQVAIVEKWSAEHPRKTRQSIFLEQWPNCKINYDSVINICPRNIDANYICDLERFSACTDCLHGFWLQEVE